MTDIPADITPDIKIDAPGYENKNIEYREEIEKGFVYTYKVVLYTKSGVSGADSNYVDFSFWTQLSYFVLSGIQTFGRINMSFYANP